jgi:hypothetical protein
VSLVGYDDGAGCWIAKNSWGTGWGAGGYFQIGYGECRIESYQSRDSAFEALVTLAAQARQTRRAIMFREEADGMVYEIYLRAARQQGGSVLADGQGERPT